MKIKVKETLCTGCKTCELACSAAHSGEFNPARSRLHVENNSLLGQSKVNLCRECKNPLCVEACAYGALSKELGSGVVLLDPKKCINCLACVAACPFQAIFVDPLDKLPLICDNCGGDPLCVKFCHHRALLW